jgi:phosphatidylglycerol---prolipoprotein diacylglyceryl transferase
MSIYGLIVGLSLAIGVNYFYKKNNVIPKKKENLFIILLIFSGIIGARFYGLIANWSYFSQYPLQIIDLRTGGLGIFGGVIFSLLFILLFSLKNKIKFLKITNLLIPVLPLCQSIGRWGNFFNKEIYGINNQPVWLYESILMLLLFLSLLKIKKHQTIIYLISYGLIRFLLEFLRLDTIPFYSITLAQFLSLSFILFAFILLKYENSRN